MISLILKISYQNELLCTRIHIHTSCIYVNEILVLMYHLNWVQKNDVLKDHFEKYSISFLVLSRKIHVYTINKLSCRFLFFKMVLLVWMKMIIALESILLTYFSLQYKKFVFKYCNFWIFNKIQLFCLQMPFK